MTVGTDTSTSTSVQEPMLCHRMYMYHTCTTTQ